MKNSTTATAIATSLLLAMSCHFTTTVAFLNLSQLPAISQDIDSLPTPAAVKEAAAKITVRITTGSGGGSGVLVAKRGTQYLILTNRHVIARDPSVQIQTPDGKQHTATLLPNTKIDPKYDLAVLQFNSNNTYQLAKLDNNITPLSEGRGIYAAGFPFDATSLGFSSGEVSQLLDIPFDNGTQIGYTTNRGERGIRQGMSGGPILDSQGNLIGINTISAAPILPQYTYADGTPVNSRRTQEYAQANWGVPIYNFLTQLDANILYSYDNFPKVERQMTPTGYMAQLNQRVRQQTVRIENSGGNGSGVIVAKEGSTYYVLTAKHVIEDIKSKQLYENNKIVTHDQENYRVVNSQIVQAEGVDLAIIKFTSTNNYPVAQLGEYSPNRSDLVLAGGFPARNKINSPLWQWQLNPGFVFDPELGKLATQNRQSFSNGYDLIYSSISYGGMSGGPVFDTAGKVIGIHGKAEVTDQIILGNSLGISIQTFTGIADKLQVKSNLLRIVRNPPATLSQADRNSIISAMENIAKPQETDDGKRWLAYGNQLHRTRQYDRAMEAFEKAIAKGEVLRGSYGKALAAWASDRLDIAEAAIARAIALIPSNERVAYYYFWKYQSVILQEQKKYELALQAIDIAIQLEPADITLNNEKVRSLIQQKKYSEALSIYNEIIRREPSAYAYSNRGSVKSDLGDKQGALADFTQAILLNPNYAIAYSNRGLVKSDLGDNQGALADYTQAIRINPNFDIAYSNRGLVKLELGDKQGALDDFAQAIRSNPNSADAYLNRGVVKFQLGDKQGALDDYNQAIRLNPNLNLAYHHRGNVRSDLGDKQGAIADYTQAIRLNLNDPRTYYNRGNDRSDLGDKQGAIADYNQAIRLNPNYAEAYANRGIVKSELGDKQGAIADLTKAAQLFQQQGRMNDYNRAIETIRLISQS